MARRVGEIKKSPPHTHLAFWLAKGEIKKFPHPRFINCGASTGLLLEHLLVLVAVLVGLSFQVVRHLVDVGELLPHVAHELEDKGGKESQGRRGRKARQGR